ncbi:MAG: malonyl-CoA decarboxylase family protein [Novosphingobium sp.]
MNLANRNSGAEPAKAKGALELALTARFGRMLEKLGFSARKRGKGGAAQPARLIDLAELLLSLKGRASGPSLASAFFDLYEASDMAARREFLLEVRARFPRDGQAIAAAITAWQTSPDEASAKALHRAAVSQCQKMIRMLNLAPGGIRRLIHMRADLLAGGKLGRGEAALDADFEYVFSGWFNAGFLELRRIDWETPAAVLERVIRYEAVHSIQGWDDLRRRVEPADRRCYAFFHPQMADDPLIFVEVALTDMLPAAIDSIIADEREVIDPRSASHAIFYSISNCQQGLRGIPFGNFLIKQVVELLRAELPQLSCFATLSPLAGFARWFAQQDGAEVSTGDALRAKAARYLVTGRGASGAVLDPVARFHLGNGARLEAVHAGADLSANGQRQSHGVMVNYVYDLAKIESNLLALTELDEVAHSPEVSALVEQAAALRSEVAPKAA